MEDPQFELTHEELIFAQSLIDAAQPQTVTLKQFYGAAWNEIESPTNFGGRFAASVVARRLRDIALTGGITSARARIYRIKTGDWVRCDAKFSC